MKKWLRRNLIASVVFALTLAALYEAATHVGRGWLRGEAFYEGRPTSYWRTSIDDWMARLVSPEDAVRSVSLQERNMQGLDPDEHEAFVIAVSATVPRPQTWTRRLFDVLRSEDEFFLDTMPPSLLLYGSLDAEPVLLELAREAKYRPVAERALVNVQLIRKMNDAGKQPRFMIKSGA
jgi:hypothetical protein